MNFKIIAAIVGIIVSMAFSVSCQGDDVVSIQQIICDNEGNVYNDGYEWALAQAEDDCGELYEVQCPTGFAQPQ